MRAHTKETQQSLTPAKALRFLQEGNDRFLANLRANRNLLQQVNETRDGQFPFAAILSCIDSRTSAELIFDQGLGDVFSIRIAGNFANDDILGSLEFACRVAGSKLVVVLGHTGCGAIRGACDGVELGHLTGLLSKIRPALAMVPEPAAAAERTAQNTAFVEAVATANVEQTVRQIRERSAVLRELLEQGAIGLVGAMYDVASGAVAFQVPPGFAAAE
ncbi:MAG: carbonic anhydrase [Planctomycetes bacterium]|nr:carbonic anhydrase [Planctomycetota bacterium]